MLIYDPYLLIPFSCSATESSLEMNRFEFVADLDQKGLVNFGGCLQGTLRTVNLCFWMGDLDTVDD
jgi:hypothetical protein